MTGKLNHLLFLSAVFIQKLPNLYLGRLRNDPRHRQRLNVNCHFTSQGILLETWFIFSS